MGLFKKFRDAWFAPMSFDSLDDDFYDRLEESLILADVGMDVALDATEKLRRRAYDDRLLTADQVKGALREILAEKLEVGDSRQVELLGRCNVITDVQSGHKIAHILDHVAVLVDVNRIQVELETAVSGALFTGKERELVVQLYTDTGIVNRSRYVVDHSSSLIRTV